MHNNTNTHNNVEQVNKVLSKSPTAATPMPSGQLVTVLASKPWGSRYQLIKQRVFNCEILMDIILMGSWGIPPEHFFKSFRYSVVHFGHICDRFLHYFL